MKRWIEPDPVMVPQELQQRVGGHPLVAATLVRRGITDVDQAMAFLDPDAYAPAPPSDLPGMATAVERILQAIRNDEKICVWGDFDVDGQTSTTLLVSTLNDLGAQVSYHIPIRETESHGITMPALKKVLAGGVQLVVTCDTGSSEHEPIAYAQSQGVDVVVTDHHTLPPELPHTCALINPQMLAHTHPLRALPGVGVAYKLAEALYAAVGRGQDAEQHLDLVALGIVADVASQTGDTRYLLQRGLAALRRTRRLGLKALLKTAELNPALLSEEHIGFGIAPRMNALGRLADANVAVELLTTDDRSRAELITTQLEGLNARRKLMCDQVFQAAMIQIDTDTSLLDHAALVLAQPTWPAGVIGIVASRLVEHFHKPTILIANPPDALARGSARSIEGLNITSAIATQAGMLARFGGHPMAAGLVIEAEKIPEFRRGLSQAIERMDATPNEAELRIDGRVSLAQISLDLIADLGRLSPFGAGNPPLTLVTGNLSITNPRAVGRNREHRQLIVRDEAGNAQQVMWWRGSEWALPHGKIDLAYTLRATDFQGNREVQLEWLDARPLAGEAQQEQTSWQTIEVLDHRTVPNPQALLKRFQDRETLQVWCEAEAAAHLSGRNRLELSHAETLAIWTIPPSSKELQLVLEKVSPEKVYIFAQNPGMDAIEALLNRLAGLLKFALNQHQGKIQVTKLAANSAQKETAVRVAIAWLQAKGLFSVMEEDNDTLRIGEGTNQTAESLPQITLQLKTLLAESTAYRTHFLKADKDQLISFGSQ